MSSLRERYEAVIGLEVHAQLRTATKIFCACPVRFGDPPNANVCPVCLGHPGALPVLNRQAVAFAIRFGLAVGAELAAHSVFARKNYFYPDLPKGYQISQFDLPVVAGGRIEIAVDGQRREIGLTRAHLEEDAGKNLHDHGAAHSSHVDYNRAGTPLLEIVSEPELRSPDEAMAYLKVLRALVRALGICDGNMQEGSFRCDANISVRPRGATELGTRSELKNLNSFRFVGQALAFEIGRQIELVDSGGQVVQETRLYDEATRQTRAMRGKEESHDYRYFPDPDLLPLAIDAAWIEAEREALPERPAARQARYVDKLGLRAEDAVLLNEDPALGDYFERALVVHPGNPKSVANWVINEALRLINAVGGEVASCPVSAQAIGKLVALIDAGTISGKIAKDVFVELEAGRGDAPAAIVAAKGWALEQDDDALDAAIEQVLAANPDSVTAYRGGKKQVVGFLVGQVMKQMKGKADPRQVNALLRELLERED